MIDSIDHVDHACLILKPGNKEGSCAKWHQYYESVYGHEVQGDVDLRQFSWFYHSAPLASHEMVNCSIHELKNVPTGNVAHITPCELPGPECVVQRAGHFVSTNRRDISKDEYLEVIRTNQGDGAKETRAAWFYPVVGSGMFIKNSKMELRNSLIPEAIKMLEDGHMANDTDLEVFTHVHTGHPQRCKRVLYNQLGIMTCSATSDETAGT